MSLVVLIAGAVVLALGVAAVFAVLFLVLRAVRSSGRSASRGVGPGEGGAAFHAGTAPGPEYGSRPDWQGRAAREGEYSAEDGPRP
ncbi:hypothetical protein [Nocardiopsis composta]|uniref:Uncharacterized protein n=1 Tax=Nocardiopsis composta TaxID=157465 RepID=A0A7W8VEV4_9ACTN|nr:hypothetical protein [Nocardiopsis composta]MBB5433450.1 hypothetical protein [Nocardiopsis composta]